MAQCSFCGQNFQYEGKMFVLSSGKILYFCSSKCEKNHNLGRKGREIRWTKTAQHLKKTTVAKK